MGTCYIMGMRIVARRTLREYCEKTARARSSVEAWYAAVSKADWVGPGDVRKAFPKADFIGNDRVVFNVGGNEFRIVVSIWYEARTLWIKFVGTHAEYDKIKAATVDDH